MGARRFCKWWPARKVRRLCGSTRLPKQVDSTRMWEVVPKEHPGMPKLPRREVWLRPKPAGTEAPRHSLPGRSRIHASTSRPERPRSRKRTQVERLGVSGKSRTKIPKDPQDGPIKIHKFPKDGPTGELPSMG